MFAGKVHHLRHFCFGDLVGEDAAFADPVMVDVQHDSRRRVAVLVEEALEHEHHELHRGVVVIQQENAVEVRPFRLRLPVAGACLQAGKRRLRLRAIAIR